MENAPLLREKQQQTSDGNPGNANTDGTTLLQIYMVKGIIRQA